MKGIALLCAATAALASLTLSAGPAGAAVINYNETSGPDFPSAAVPQPLPNFVLDVGVNTISGNLGLSDADHIAWTIPAGMQMTSASIAMTDTTGGVGSVNWDVREGSASSYTGTLVGSWIALGSTTTALPLMPMNPGTYNLGFASMAGSAANAASDYTFSFTVVPEPASLGLLAVGSFALARRRRAR